MRWAKIKRMYVPQIGLADGLIHILYEKHKHEIEVFRRIEDSQMPLNS